MWLKKKIGNFRMTYRDSGIEITTGDQWKPMGIKKKTIRRISNIGRRKQRKKNKKKVEKNIKWNKNTNLENLKLQWHYIDVYV